MFTRNTPPDVIIIPQSLFTGIAHQCSGVVVTIFVVGLGLALAEINIKKVQKQEKNPYPFLYFTMQCTLVSKRCRDEALYICLHVYIIPTLMRVHLNL